MVRSTILTSTVIQNREVNLKCKLFAEGVLKVTRRCIGQKNVVLLYSDSNSNLHCKSFIESILNVIRFYLMHSYTISS